MDFVLFLAGVQIKVPLKVLNCTFFQLEDFMPKKNIGEKVH